MTYLKSFIFTFLTSIALMTPAVASDFEWLDDLNIQARANSSGFHMQLATRFKIGSAEVNAVLGNVESPSDAYMVLRLGELSHKPMQEVLHVYQGGKRHGWGAMARRLGIKPGSAEFHALKRGHDLNGKNDRHNGVASQDRKGNSKVKHASHGNGKGKGKWK